jgi:hypothetical protein
MLSLRHSAVDAIENLFDGWNVALLRAFDKLARN